MDVDGCPHWAQVASANATAAETRAFYDSLSRSYDVVASWSEGPLQRAALARLALRPGERVLEIGSGTGGALVEVAVAVGPTGAVCGVDVSPGMLAVARAKLAGASLLDRVFLAAADARAVPLRDSIADAAYTSFTLELLDVEGIASALAECRRVLTRGGRLGVLALARDGSPRALARLAEWLHRRFPHWMDCRPIYAAEAVEAAGFRCVTVERRSWWVPVEIVVAEKTGE